MLRLRIVAPNVPPYERALDGSALVIGRSSACDLTLADRFLSRKHARLFHADGKVMIEDLGARNGTFVNERRIEEPTELRPGDVIRLASSELTLVDPSVPASRESTREHSKEVSLDDASILMPVDQLLKPADASSGIAEIHGEAALRRRAQELSIMNEVHTALGRFVELDDLLQLILDRMFDHLQPQLGVIFLRNDDGEYVRAATKMVDGEKDDIVCSRALVHEVAEKRNAALVLDVAEDERFAQAQSIVMSGVRSFMAAPLLDEHESLGMIVLSSKTATKQYGEEDVQLLVSLAAVAAMRLRNAKLAEEAAERRRLEQELQLARNIQLALLPDELPRIPQLQLFGGNIPYSGVSGDYFEVIARREGAECLLVLADVSGKGMPASLLTASLEALSAGPIEDGDDPKQICDVVSHRLYDRTPPERFATMFVASIEPATGKLVFTNAGHNPSLIVRTDGTVEELQSTGLPVAMMPGVTYELSSSTLDVGDLLVLYTDGYVEACNAIDEEYGLERLTEVCLEQRGAGLDEIAARINEDLASFAGNVPFGDDRTLILARRTQEA